jgi:alpha-tubulin suppressor-like RCC1 family protein
VSVATSGVFVVRGSVSAAQPDLAPADNSAALALSSRRAQEVINWGYQGFFQAASTNRSRDGLYRISMAPRLIDIAGRTHRMGNTANGEVWVWGNNQQGQLGDATTTTRLTPTRVGGLPPVTGIAAGDVASLAIANGEIWQWGTIACGTTLLVPTRVTTIANVVAVGAGRSHQIALTADGRVWTWGCGNGGSLGLGSPGGNFSSPQPVPGLPPIVKISTGENFNLALAGDGTVWTWGDNSLGFLGLGPVTSPGPQNNVLSPRLMTGLPVVAQVNAGYHTGFALTEQGELWGWGQNNGAIGDGTLVDRFVPIRVAGLPALRSINSHEHALALTTTGEVYAWGSTNGFGQTNPRVPASSAPVVSPTLLRDLANVEVVAASNSGSSAIGPAYSDIQLTLSPTSGSTNVGDTFSIAGTIFNAGPFPAADLRVTVQAGAGVYVEGASGALASCVVQPSQITCPSTTLGVNGTIAGTLSVAPTSPGTRRVDVAAIPTSDPNAGNSVGASLLTAAGTACTMIGTPNADTLDGTVGNDVLCGLSGNDKINGLAGNDIAYGGADKDSIDGGSGTDAADGGSGTNDSCVAESKVNCEK